MGKHANKKLPFIMIYVPDKSKIQKICDKDVVENGGTLKFVPNNYNNRKLKCVLKLLF